MALLESNIVLIKIGIKGMDRRLKDSHQSQRVLFYCLFGHVTLKESEWGQPPC